MFAAIRMITMSGNGLSKINYNPFPIKIKGAQ
jgi:hypothetical protein